MKNGGFRLRPDKSRRSANDPIAAIGNLRQNSRMARVKVGDVFLVPLDGERYGIGQLAGDWKGELYVVIYNQVVARDALPAEIDGADLQFAALTLDAKFYHGDWLVIGNRRDNLAALPQPLFKIEMGGHTYVEARDRSVTRRASQTEDAVLRHRTVVAPVRIENALKASHGLAEWNSRYDELRADYAISSAKLIEG